METAVRLLIDRGVADPARIGLTGMSNGATTATYALLHSNLFAAVAMSHVASIPPCDPRWSGGSTPFSRPGLSEADRRRHRLLGRDLPVSKRKTREDSDPPPDCRDELMSALESYTALREVGAPIDMFVFPGEHHVKWQARAPPRNL